MRERLSVSRVDPQRSVGTGMNPWSVIVKGPGNAWSTVAEGTQEDCTEVVNLYHAKRPDVDAKVRLISPSGVVTAVSYKAPKIKDAVPLSP